MMARVVMLVTVLAVAPVVMGAGGFNPPGFPTQFVGSEFTATIQLDPHMAAGDPRGDGIGVLASDVTTTAKRASIRLVGPRRKGISTVSQAEFTALPSFALYRGCDLSLTQTRFVYTEANPTTLGAWVPPASLEFLFRPHGVTVSATSIPVIVAINGDANCFTDVRNEDPIADGGDGQASTPGILLMDVTIQFLAPATP